MTGKVLGFRLDGGVARVVSVTATLRARGMPRVEVVGLSGSAARGCITRLRCAFSHADLPWPKRPTVVEVAGMAGGSSEPWLDLPIAVSIMAAMGVLPHSLDGVDLASTALFGQVSPRSEVQATRGVACALHAAEHAGLRLVAAADMVVWMHDARRLQHGRWTRTLRDLFAAAIHQSIDATALVESRSSTLELSEIVGQEGAKQAVVAAAAGGHALLLCGPPGCGKSRLLSCLHSLLPTCERGELRASWMARSYLGLAPVYTRPLEILSPGGGSSWPAQHALAAHDRVVSRDEWRWRMAAGGVMLIDELDHASKKMLDGLHDRLERQCDAPHRLGHRPLFGATMNADASSPQCTIPAGLLDRIALVVPMYAVQTDAALGLREGLSTAAAREVVQRCWSISSARNGCLNGDMTREVVVQSTKMEPTALMLLRRVGRARRLSVRAVDEVRRVAQTVADIASHEFITEEDMQTALSWRWALPASSNSDHSCSPGANPRRMVFSQHERGSTNWSK
ncbi:MAG: ATP-binding protein [Planctomycetota bacterium]|nr:ATP-binding protein [Planctomycetota bacterium]